LLNNFFIKLNKPYFMKTYQNSRRNFLGKMGLGVAGLSAIPGLLEATTPINKALVGDAEEWLKKIKGTHRIVYDGAEPHAGFPIIWNWAFYLTNNQTGVEDSDITGVCVLRHNAIPLSFKDELWAKYHLGEVFNINDNKTGKPSLRNPYYEPQEGDMPMPPIQGIKDQQARGAMFCVCELAINVYSGMVSAKMGLNHDEVKAEWMAGLHPDIQPVPSGVWALGRAQEHGCGYIYAGG
jgi:hypothetical protein